MKLDNMFLNIRGDMSQLMLVIKYVLNLNVTAKVEGHALNCVLELVQRQNLTKFFLSNS